MDLFGCSHDWEITDEKYMPADDTESEPSTIKSLLWFNKREAETMQAFTEITIRCTKCDTKKTVRSMGYKPPAYKE